MSLYSHYLFLVSYLRAIWSLLPTVHNSICTTSYRLIQAGHCNRKTSFLLYGSKDVLQTYPRTPKPHFVGVILRTFTSLMQNKNMNIEIFFASDHWNDQPQVLTRSCTSVTQLRPVVRWSSIVPGVRARSRMVNENCNSCHMMHRAVVTPYPRW